MLIRVSESFAALLSAEPQNAQALDAFENILRAHREGKHIAYISPTDIRRLTTTLNSRLSASARGVLQSLRHKWAEIAGLAREIPIQIEVVVEVPPFYSQSCGTERVLRVHYSSLTDSAHTQACVLLGENTADAECYLALAKAYLVKKGWRLQAHADIAGGGGTTTGDVFTALCASGRIVLCIVDSDKDHPDGSVGATASRAVQAAQGCAPTQSVIVLPVRAIENIIPLPLIEHVLIEQGRGAERVHIGQLLSQSGPWRAQIQYLNLKESITGYDCRRTLGTRTECHDTALSAGRAQGPCENDDSCTSRAVCQCQVAPGLGPSFLDLVRTHLLRRSPQKNNELLSDSWTETLGRLSLLVVSWTCAYRPQAA